jgi:ParB family transcriptional regulator, chromosome partitioning protein
MELEFHRLSMKHEGLRIRQRGYEARLTASLASEGQLHPVLVVSGQEEERSEYVLIDGYLRVKALQVLGRDTVEAMVLPLEESAALMFRYCQESVHPRTALEDGWFLRELVEEYGMSQAELSRRLQRTESWISRRLSLVRELPETAQELVRRDKLCGHGAMRYLVPLARAKRSDCKELVSHLTLRRTSARELKRIYLSWKSGDAEQRRLVISNPELFLKATGVIGDDEPKLRIGDERQNVTNDLQILDAVSNRARRRIREMKGTIPVAAMQGWRAAQSSFAALRETMEKRIDAGSRDADGDSEACG